MEFALLALCCFASIARAEVGPRRMLESIEIVETETGAELRIRFATPLRYLRHAPHARGREIQIEIAPIALSALDPPALGISQSLPGPKDSPIPLAEVLYEGIPVGSGRSVIVRFTRAVAFAVRPGDDMRSLVVFVPREAAKQPIATPQGEPLGAALMDSARAALTAGDVDAAIRMLTKVLSLPDHTDAPEAKELLGLARERHGQLAHAKAEYEEYLALYPQGDGATRVRQRLDALLTAHSAPPQQTGAAAVEPRDAHPISFLGSTGSWYRYESRHGEAGSSLADSSLLTDGTFVLRSQLGDWALRGQAAGSYLFDFAGGMNQNETRVSTAFLDAKQTDGPWTGTIGRQPGNTTGVFSPFDGLRVGRRVAAQWSLGAIGGLPVEYWETGRFVETGRHLYGVSLDANDLFGKVDGQLFAVEQHAEGLLDRRAIGAEFRYADAGRFLTGLLDYDVFYASLNTALLIGNWQVTPATGLNLYADYRNSPTLTTTNAIIGQNVDRVDQLTGRFSTDQIESLAEDRTARSTLVSLGATQQLGDRFQLAIDGSLSELSGTPASGGVEASPGTGWEFSLYPQLVANGLFLGNDVGLLGMRWFHGHNADTYSLIATERIPVTRSLRLIPRLRVDYRTRTARDEFRPRPDDPNSTLPAFVSATRVRNGQLTVRPFLGAEYRIGPVTLDTDCGVEWTTGSFDGGGSELSTILTFGVRYDF